EEDDDDRYVIQKTTTATLDFAAVTAQAARILRKWEDHLPGLADSCLEASQNAWEWAQANRNILYDQEAHNDTYDPDIETGAYGDRNADDEFAWAGVELYLATRQDSYFTAVYPAGLDEEYGIPGWPNVATLGLYSLYLARDSLTQVIDLEDVTSALLNLADDLTARYEANPYRITMTSDDYYWGSNSVAANQGMALIFAFLASPDTPLYKDVAVAQLDYLLGRNPTGYCYVTGFGEHSPLYPHHRPSASDRVDEPVPGFLVGGPNPGQQDNQPPHHEVYYASSLPAKSYADEEPSYASNEVTINWNAPLVFLSGALEALQGVELSTAPKRQSLRNVFTPAITMTTRTISLNLPQGWSGQAVFTNLNGKVLNKVAIADQKTVKVDAQWSNQITLLRIDAENTHGQKRTYTQKLVQLQQ
ncbi:MAG: glycoside hydrolase family 9 protein, partial [Chitinivibrionales bacterium]